VAFRSSIDPPGDRDLYKLNLAAGDLVRFQYAHSSGTGRQIGVLVDQVGVSREIPTSGIAIASAGVYSLIVRDDDLRYSSSGVITVRCDGTCPGPPMVSSLFPHFADGGGWRTAITLFNASELPTRYSLTRRNSAGQTLARSEGVIGPYGSAFQESTARFSDPTQEGSIVLMAPSSVGGSLAFRSAEAPGQRGEQTASVPLSPAGSSGWLVPFDNQNGLLSGYALASLSGTATSVTLEALDENGAILQSRGLTLNPGGHTSFLLTDEMAATAGKRGLFQIRAAQQHSIGVVGLRFMPEGAFTSLGSVPVVSPAATGGTISPPRQQFYFVPQLATGGSWTTELFAFSSDRSVSNTLRYTAFQGNRTRIEGLTPFWDGPGQAWPINFEGAGSRSTHDVAVGQNVSFLRSRPGDSQEGTGWLIASRFGDTGGVAIFRQTIAGRIPQEASVPFFPSGVSRFWLPVDQRGATVGFALVNPSAAATQTISLTFRDAEGTTIGTNRFQMPPLAHVATTLESLVAGAGPNSFGSLEVSSSGGDIAGIGLRFEGSAFTALPVIR
jgi:hypothetical protein